MEKAKLNIGGVIRTERQRQGISLEEASRKTGVSKAMLGQIERDESNPTLSTVWKISVGLRIPMATLLAQNQSGDYKVTKLTDVEPVEEGSGSIRVYNIFPFDPVTGFDFLFIQIQPNTLYPSTGHPNVAEEYVVVTSGHLTLHIADKIYELEAGDSIAFAGNEDHKYETKSSEGAIFQSILRY